MKTSVPQVRPFDEMSRIVKGILIDPFACTVTEVEHDAASYKEIYKLLSHESMPVDCFTTATSRALDGRDSIFVDDEGLLKPCSRFFVIRGEQPYAGKGLVLGADREGDTISASTKLVNLRREVFFLQRDDRGSSLNMTMLPWVKERLV